MRCFLASKCSPGRFYPPRPEKPPEASVVTSWLQGLGKLFRALPIGKHSPRCRPDSPETWRGKPGPTGGPRPFAKVDLGGTTKLASVPGKEKVGAQLELGLQGRWECRPEYAYCSRLFWGHIIISLTSHWEVSPWFSPCFSPYNPCPPRKHCRVPGNMAGSCCSRPLSRSSSRNSRILSTGAIVTSS